MRSVLLQEAFLVFVRTAMADRFSTPPRTRQLPALNAVLMDDEFVVDMVGALTGQNLGQLKVTSSTTLMEVRVPLIGATGGGVNMFEIHLLDARGQVFENSSSTPFANASPHDVFQVIKVKMSDMIYLDLDRKTKREMNASES